MDPLLSREVVDYDLPPTTSISKLISLLENGGGFTAKKLGVALKILLKMLKEEDCINFLAFPACVVATGMRGLLAGVLKRGFFDIVITTGGTVDHDIAKSFSKYYHGSFESDDSLLYEKRIHRLGNIFIPFDNYGPVIEDFTIKLVSKLLDKGIEKVSPSRLLYEAGLMIDDEHSILRQAAKNKIPIFSPGLLDSSFGTSLFVISQTKKFQIDFLEDMKKLADICFPMKKSGALIIGGGISKHHTIWWNQFKGGLDYAVYITTAVEWDGSLSGARDREAISWGKISESANRVTVEGDATIIFPLLAAALYELKVSRTPKKLLTL